MVKERCILTQTHGKGDSVHAKSTEVSRQGRKASATHYLFLLQTDSRSPMLQDVVNLLLNHEQLQVALVLVQVILQTTVPDSGGVNSGIIVR